MQLFVAISILSFSIVFGAHRIKLQFRLKRNLDLISTRHPRSVHTAPEELLGLHKNEHLQPKDTIVTSQNTVKTKYIETYKDLPVIGEAVVLEQARHGQFTETVSGGLVGGIAEDVPSIEPLLTVDDVFKIAVEESGPNPKYIVFKLSRDVSLAIYIDYEVDVTETSQENSHNIVKAVLVYKVIITNTDPKWPREMQFIIDANTGEILHESNLLESVWSKRQQKTAETPTETKEIFSIGGNTKTGPIRYGFDEGSFIVESKDGVICKVQNENVAVVHMNFSAFFTDDDETEGYRFNCESTLNDSINGGYSPISDAFFYFNTVFEMYFKWFGTKPVKEKTMIATHYGKESEDIYYLPNLNVIAIGDGKDRFYPMADLGLIAHEISHGFTFEHSQLEYSEQSGGLNEAFSDLASETAEYYLGSRPDWKIGWEVAKHEKHILRWLDDPTRDNASVSSMEDYCPGMNVHHSSGIFNQIFYFMSNYQGWDIRKAFQVFLTANKMYWRQNTDFAKGACGVIKAAKDHGYPIQILELTFRAFGIEPCVGVKYNFQNLIKISVSHQKNFSKYFELKDLSTDKVTIEVRIEAKKPANYDLTVIHQGQNIVALKSNKTGSVDIMDVKEGKYNISITGNVPLFSIYVITGMIFHQNFTVDKAYEHAYAKFELKESHNNPDMGLIIRVTGNSKRFQFFAKYGENIDMSPLMVDNYGRKLDDVTKEVLYCSTRPGTYNIGLFYHGIADDIYYRTFSIEVYLIFNLFPRKEFE